MSKQVTLTPQQEELLVSISFKKNLGEMLGPFLMAMIIDCYFCGIITVQFLSWFSRYSGDRNFIKFFVFFGMFLGIGSTISLIAYSMRNFVYGFGSFLQFADVKFTQVFVVLDTATSVTVQSFYAQRVYKLLKNSKIFVVAFVLVARAEAAACISTIIVFNLKYHNILDADRLVPTAYLGMGSQIAADVLITCCTAIGLWNSRTGWSGTDKVSQRLVTVTVETQLPPTIIAIIHIIVYVLKPSAMFYICISFILGKPYLIGMLSILNARQSLRNDVGNPADLHTYNSSRPAGNTSLYYEYNPSSGATDQKTAVASQQSQDKSAYGFLSLPSVPQTRSTDLQPDVVIIGYDRDVV